MKLGPIGEEQIDDRAVESYFDSGLGTAAASMSMVAHEHEIPSNAVAYRLMQELRTIKDWLDQVEDSSRVLDVGCGAGAWVEVFARRYGQVIGIERSPSMVEAAIERVAVFSNVQIVHSDGRKHLPEGTFDLIFLGGLCMYLNDADVLELLRSLKNRLSDNGTIILRESTVRKGSLLANGEYQAVYRSVDIYRRLIADAGIPAPEVRSNFGYANMALAEELVDFRRKWLPFLPRHSSFLSGLTWWGLRAASPLSFWILPWVLARLNIPWPTLQNHFFKLRPQ